MCAQQNYEFTRLKSVAHGALVGAVAGAAGAWAMNRFQVIWSEISARAAARGVKRPSRNDVRARPEQGEPRSKARDAESATERAAGKIVRSTLGREATRRQRRAGGAALHYLFGAATGATYGAAAELAPVITSGAGLPFGTTVWIFADEVAIPAMKLSRPPNRHPVSTHLLSLGAHFVYGFTTEGIRRALAK